jgi:uncharacterized protein DUF1801
LGNYRPSFESRIVLTNSDQSPPVLQKRLQDVRQLILQVAEQNPDIGEIEESIKWGQASFATKPKTGTPIRIGGDKDTETYSLFVPCSTRIISEFRDIHPDMFEYRGNREIRLPLNKIMPQKKLSLFIKAALGYYL